MFALITLVLALVLLFLYHVVLLAPDSRNFVVYCRHLAIGVCLLGYGLDPYSVLVPFLVRSRSGSSHGVQIVNQAGAEAAKGYDSLTAARLAFRALYIPGMLALLSDAIGFLTLLFIQIDVIQKAVAASVGVAAMLSSRTWYCTRSSSLTGISTQWPQIPRIWKKVDKKWVWMSASRTRPSPDLSPDCHCGYGAGYLPQTGSQDPVTSIRGRRNYGQTAATTTE